MSVPAKNYTINMAFLRTHFSSKQSIQIRKRKEKSEKQDVKRKKIANLV